MIENIFFAFTSIMALCLVVCVHELGHLLVAKWTGMAVETFSIGFGKPLWKFKYGGTNYQIAPILLGGYVKPKGEFEAKEGEEQKQRDSDEFLAKPWYSRAAVVLAGPIMNFIFPVVVLFFLYSMVGKQEGPPVIGEVIKGRPAYDAGVKPGDYILEIDGIQTPSYTMLADLVDNQARSHQGQPLKVTLLRGDKILHKEVLAQLNAEYGKYLMGVRIQPGKLGYSRTVKYAAVGTPAEKAGFQPGDVVIKVGGTSLKEGMRFNRLFADVKKDIIPIVVNRGGKEVTIEASGKPPFPDEIYDAEAMGLIGLVFEYDQMPGQEATKTQYKRLDVISSAKHAFFDSLEQGLGMVYGMGLLITGKLGVKDNLGGPVTIMRMAHQKSKSGFYELIQFMCMISLILGIMNLLPIPLLDGGTFFFCCVEALRGKPLAVKTQNVLQNVFGFLLITLMVLITFNDIIKWIQSMAE